VTRVADVASEVQVSRTSAGGTTLGNGGPEQLAALTQSQLEHALDAHRRKLKVYESLKSLR
jgi:hypothetical protein